jgi:phosphinothricin acetyltransferase
VHESTATGGTVPFVAATDEQEALEIRPATRRDAATLRDIHNHFVDHSVATFELLHRTIDEQVQWIDDHSASHPSIVAIVDGHVVGFGSLSPFRDRAAYATTVEDSVYVLEEFQGRGVGARLLGELVRLAEAHGFHSVIARVVGHNAPSIRLHEHCGFIVVGTEREIGRKFGRWLDVVEMQRML